MTDVTAPAHVAQKQTAPLAPTFKKVDPNKSATNEITLAPLPCGIVLFDHVDEGMAGTAYLPETPVQRIRTPNDLRNDVLWVSNLYATDEKARNHPNLRSGYYFRVLLAEIAHDMGLQCSRDGQMAPEDAQKLSIITTRTMTIAARAYGWDVAEMGPMRVQEPFLVNDIQKMLPSPPVADARFREDLTRALTQAHQELSQPDWPSYTFEPDSVYVTLRFNRVSYAQQILDCPVPTGRGWARIEGVEMTEQTLQYCLANPCLVRATVEWDNASSDMAALAAYGQAGKRRNPMRLWMAQPELAWISQYARVTISGIWVDQDGYQKLAPNSQLPELFSKHPEASLSYSAGLVAMNHWLALSSTKWNRKARTLEANVWATWMAAVDRAYMFSMALKAYQAGFHVERYGAGALRLRVTRERLDELAAFKEEHGFLYPDLASLLEKDGL